MWLPGPWRSAGWIVKRQCADYKSDFKDRIIEPLVGFVDPSLTYEKHGCIHEGLFMASDLFRHRIDAYRGDDKVSGVVGKTPFAFSEVHALYKTVTYTKNGGRQEHWHTIFKGLFFVAEFNKDFNGTTVVLPDTAERLFGRLGQKLQSMNTSRGELIKLEDPEFEKYFAVYGDDQIEARYILSPSLMRRITDFKVRTGRQIHIAFNHSQVFIAISYKRDLFEPRLMRTLLDFEPIRDYFSDLATAVGIVEDLNLNLRIWTKE